MQTPTLTEQVLCRTWMATPDSAACWYDRFEEFSRVARVLEAETRLAGAALYREASQMALARAVYKMRAARPADLEETAVAA